MKRQFLSLAVVVVSGSLALTACNKSGSGGSQITGVAASKPSAPAQAVHTESEEIVGREGHEDVDTQTDPQQRPAAKAVPDDCMFGAENICETEADPEAADESTGAGAIAGTDEDDEAETTGATPTNKRPDLANDPAISHVPEGGLPNVNAEAAGVKWLSRYYTGAAQDGYRDHLTSVMAAKMEKSKLRAEYYRNAEAITRVKVLMEGNQMQVTLEYTEGGKNKMSILGGNVHATLGSAQLKLMNSAAKKHSGGVFGTRAMSGVGVCADQTAGVCNTVVLRLVIGDKKAPVWILVRSTNANIGVKDRKDIGSGTQESVFYNYFKDTKRGILESVRTVNVDSFEVIHGISGMKITAVMQDNQVVSAQGLLLAPRESILTNVPWTKTLELEDLALTNDARSGFKSTLQSSVKSVRLITNDGRREFTLNYTFAGGGNQDIVYSRLQPAIIDISSIGLIFRDMKIGSEL